MTKCYPVPENSNGTRGFGLGDLGVEVVAANIEDIRFIEDYLSKQPNPKTTIPPKGRSLVYCSEVLERK